MRAALGATALVLQEMLSHADPAFTMRTYPGVNPGEHIAIAAKVDAYLVPLLAASERADFSDSAALAAVQADPSAVEPIAETRSQ